MKKLVIWLFVLIIIVLAGVYFARNVIVAGAIEEGSTYALGVNADLGSANVDLAGGSLTLNDYRIDNPPGYDSERLMRIKFGILDISSGSVFSDTIVVDSLILDSITINLIQHDDRGNFKEVMDYARKIEYDTSSSTTLVRIKKVGVKNINVQASLKILNQVDIDKSFTVEDITLTNIGGGDGATVGEITSVVFGEILKRAVAKGKGELSDQFGKGFEGLDKSALEKAGSDAVEKVKDIGTSLFGGDKK
jgi:hypothetical protein